MRVYIAGHKGMVGAAIWRLLEKKGNYELIGKSRNELDLRDQHAVNNFFRDVRPNMVIDAAAKVGGILANSTFPYQFLMENMQIQNNLIDFSLKYDVSKFIFLGSSCIYPKHADQPLKESYLLTSSLEPTNEWYAIAKISGVKACEAIRKQFDRDFISLMPTNLYGPYDNFDLTTSHVLPAMIRKFHDAKSNQMPHVELWGTGTPKREFLHVDDLADAVHFSLQNQMEENLYNVGTGSDISIAALAGMIQNVTHYIGEIHWNTEKPDGTPRKLLDVSKLNSKGWKAKINLEDGILDTYQWFLQNQSTYKEVKF